LNQTPPSNNGHKPPPTKPGFDQGCVNPQNYPVPIHQFNRPVQQMPHPHPFYPNQHPPMFPMQMAPPPVPFFPHPMQTAQMPWQSPHVYPYQQYLQPNQPPPHIHQQSQNMPKNYNFNNTENWKKATEFSSAPSQPPKSLSSVQEIANCCTGLQNVSQEDDQNGNQFQPLVTQSPSIQLKQTYSNLEDQIDLDKFKEDDYENKTKLKVWQTSDQLPDPEVKTAYWKAELKRQIDEKREQRRVEEAKAVETERLLDKKIQEHLEAERRDLNLGYCSTEQTLKHKLKTREIGREHRVNNHEDPWKSGAGDPCNNDHTLNKYVCPAANPHKNRMPNNNARKLSPPVPASQRSLQQIQNDRHAESNNIFTDDLNSGRSHLQRTSASDPSFLNYIVRALENETEKQERNLRKKLQRNNKKQ